MGEEENLEDFGVFRVEYGMGAIENQRISTLKIVCFSKENFEKKHVNLIFQQSPWKGKY